MDRRLARPSRARRLVTARARDGPAPVCLHCLLTCPCMLCRADLDGADMTNKTTLLPVATAATAEGFSQSGEDLHAYATYFYGMRNGSFLEMGALDGAWPPPGVRSPSATTSCVLAGHPV